MMKKNIREIKAFMALADVKGVDIARSLSVTPTWVSLVLRGHKQSARVQKAIADAVGKPVGELWPRNDNKAA
jgi:hypothetical protein